MTTIDLSGFDYQALIFDCDGTLVNTAPLHYKAFCQALSEQNTVLPLAWYNQRRGLSRHALLSQLKVETHQALDVTAAVAKSEVCFLQLVDSVQEIPQVANIVRSHYGRIPMAVASSGQRASVVKSLQAATLFHLFDYCITAEDVTEHKPSPEVFLTAAAKLGVAPNKCLVFEDSDEGIEAAIRAEAMVIDVRKKINRKISDRL